MNRNHSLRSYLSSDDNTEKKTKKIKLKPTRRKTDAPEIEIDDISSSDSELIGGK